jgi:2'-5' RNA ligase
MGLIIGSKQATKTSLYFIALIPDRELRGQIRPFKLDFAERFESCKALKVYTHITMKAPFKCSGYGREEMLDWFAAMHLQQKPFHLYLNGFGAFRNKHHPVVYIKPEPSRDLLNMQRKLMVGFNSILPANVHSVDKAFRPHMTVAYRDLTPENFSLSWQEYKDKPFYEVFDVHSIYLLEHDTRKWNLIDTHKLG